MAQSEGLEQRHYYPGQPRSLPAEWVVKQKQARKRQRDSDRRSIQRGKDEIESDPPALLVGQLYPEIRQGVDGARLRIDLQGFGISVHLSFHQIGRAECRESVW